MRPIRYLSRTPNERSACPLTLCAMRHGRYVTRKRQEGFTTNKKHIKQKDMFIRAHEIYHWIDKHFKLYISRESIRIFNYYRGFHFPNAGSVHIWICVSVLGKSSQRVIHFARFVRTPSFTRVKFPSVTPPLHLHKLTMLPPALHSFLPRHIGPTPTHITKMLKQLQKSSLDEFVDACIPKHLQTKTPLKIGEPVSEHDILKRLRKMADQNRIKKNYIGMVTPSKTRLQELATKFRYRAIIQQSHQPSYKEIY